MKKLFLYAQKKKQVLFDERKKIMEDGFCEREMKIFVKTIHKILQAEIDRFVSYSFIIKGFYRGIEHKPLEEFTGPVQCVINYDVSSLSQTRTSPKSK
jgi:hypothetical protein